MPTFDVINRIRVSERCANIDALYGPYSNIAEALAGVRPVRRSIGRTVGIVEADGVVEYWWKSGTEDSDLVKKQESLLLSIHLYGQSTFIKEEGESIYGQFIVEGGLGVKKAILYQVVDEREIAVQDYINVGKGSPYTFQIPNPSVSGTYVYRLRVLDSLDNYAIAEDSSNYVEYRLHYGGLSAVYNLVELNAIKIKNYETVANQWFQINIAVRDNTFRISNVYLTDQTDEHSTGVRIALQPYVDKTTQSDTFLGNNYYQLPNSLTLEQFSGKKCSIVISYVEGTSSRDKVTELFKLLDISTLDIVPEYEGGDYYATVPSYYTFQLQSGVENISIVITPGDYTDFNFEQATVLAYRRFSLRVIPANIEKTNAQIVINYRYSYNNVEYTGSFTRVIGNIVALPEQSYFEPAAGTSVTRTTLVYADASDYTGIDDGQYYKTISTPVSADPLTSSFVLDLYCKINQQNDKSINYLTISYGGVTVATINEDEISCANQWRSLYTDTPLNEWTQIGIGVNLQETFRRNDKDVTGYYHSIYVNGMVVKTVLIDNSSIRPLNYVGGNRLVVTLGNGILVQKCFLYWRNDGEEIISPNTLQGVSIIYNNYKSHSLLEEPQDLPVLRFLKITDHEEIAEYFNLINSYKQSHGEDLLKHITTFGEIGATKASDMESYDYYYSSDDIETKVQEIEGQKVVWGTLFRQSVDIKKPAQKEYAVLCRVMWMGSVLEGIIVEVHTQGTSTLIYSVPNFKLTFWQLVGDTIQRYCPEFIPIEGSDDYYQESIYTAKADFMDSSHLNNTPTCNYYNSLIKNLINAGLIDGSPAARNGKLDAILGFPIVMEISDIADGFDAIFTNIGSFMLNIDKTGDSLGFEVDEGNDHLSCISFEGTSNDNEHGASGRFDIPDGLELKDYTNMAGEVDEAEILADYNVAKNAKGRDLDDIVDGVLVRNLPYVKWCSFLSDGLEYRYPESDIYKEKNHTLNKIMNVNHFIALYKMWWWVYNSDTLSKSDYQTEFTDYFDLDYCIIYFIQLMVYAQTDNLGKNAMFDAWGTVVTEGNEEYVDYSDVRWYPRPYDLDSEAGLDNNGNDNIAPFVEIRPEFSLNYDASRADDWDWRAANYLIDDTDVQEHPEEHLTASTIVYGAQTYDRYHFSSNKSKLWINFYKNFKTEINGFYSNLRSNGGYTPATIIALCQSMLISKLGVAQYNQDFQNKYLANSDQRLAYGNRWYKFKKWLTKRFAFCDSYFGASDSAWYNLVSRINYTIKVDAPQYIAQQYQGESNRETKFVLDNVSFSAGSGAATIITLLANQASIFETTLFKYVTYNNGATHYSNLITLDVSGNQNSLFTSITSVTGNDLNNLKYLNISNSAVQNLVVPPNVKTLIAENVNLNSFVIPDGCAVETISLRGSKILGSVDFSNLPNLQSLDLTECTFNQDISFAYLPQLSTLTMTKAVFSGTVTISNGVNVTTFDFSGLTINSVSFNGTDLQIDTVNFRNAKFSVATLNIDAICRNVRNLYFDNCEGLTHLQILNNETFSSLYCLSFAGSSIKSLGLDSSVFDCQHFSNMSSLKKVGSWNSSGGVASYTGFTFYNTKVEQIINMLWNGSGASLFRDCYYLTSIGGNLAFTNSIEYLCHRCYSLVTLPVVSITSTVVTAIYAFAGANSLSYNSVANVVSQCTNVTTFEGIFRCKQFNNNQTISLTTLFGNNHVVTNLESILSTYVGASTYRNVTNTLIITGRIPSTVINATRLFFDVRLTIPYDFLQEASALSNASEMFASCTVTFTGNNRPVQVDSHEASVTLSNAVNKNFFSANLTNISKMFYNTNVVTNDTTLFADMPLLTNTNATFGSSYVKMFSFTNSQSETESIKLNIINLWMNNPVISDISGCFANIYSVYCTGLNFHSNVDGTKTVNISGLLGLSGSDYRSYAPITINIDDIVPMIKTDSRYNVPNNSSYNGPGVFQNRSVSIITNSLDGTVFGKLQEVCRNLFNGAVLYLPSNVTRFNLSSVITSCENMFRGCRLYTQSNDPEHVYTVSDRKFVDVTMPTSCAIYTAMFRDSSVLRSLPSIASSGATDLSYMYYGCVINTADLQLPANYFEICASTLSNVTYMFGLNKYLTTLEYSSTRGLFEGCVNLSSVTYMFFGAYFLHKGIPINFFGETELPKVTNLSYMFGQTSIIYDVESNSHKYINSSTVAPLVNLDNITGMFYRNRINSSINQFPTVYVGVNQSISDGNTTVAPIAPDIFTGKTLTTISKLFEHTVINPPQSVGGFRFKGFSIGNDAFFSSSVSYIDSNFVDSEYVSSVVNADRMFYASPTGGRYHSDVTNLSVFVNSIVTYPNITKYNIAGNLVDDNIAETYKQSTVEGDALVYSGFGLQLSTNPEGTWSEYGRYIYA